MGCGDAYSQQSFGDIVSRSINILGDSTTLRSAVACDLDMMYVWESDPDTWQYSEGEYSFSQRQIQEFIDNQQGLLVDKQLRLMICLPCGEAIGMVDIFEYDAERQSAGIGILIDPAHRGKGYATDAILSAESHLRTEYGVQQMWCHVHPDNTASLKLFRRCGYTIISTSSERITLSKGKGE